MQIYLLTIQSVISICWKQLLFWQNFASEIFPDSKLHGANMEPIWSQQDPGGPHDGPMNLAIWVAFALYWDSEIQTRNNGKQSCIS